MKNFLCSHLFKKFKTVTKFIVMKKLLMLILFCSFTSVFGQPGKSRKKTPKPPKPPIYQPLSLKPAAKNKIEEALVGVSPKAFAWKIETAGNIPAKSLFRQYVELRVDQYFSKLSIKAKIYSEFNKESLDLKEGADIKETIISWDVTSKNYSVNVERNVLTLTDDETKDTEKFRVFLDKTQKIIVRLQNLNNQKIYIPAPIEYPAPMMLPN